MAQALHGPQFDGEIAVVCGGGDIRGGVVVAGWLAGIGQCEVLGGGRRGKHAAAGALGVQPGDPALVWRVWVGGAVENSSGVGR